MVMHLAYDVIVHLVHIKLDNLSTKKISVWGSFKLYFLHMVDIQGFGFFIGV